MEAFEFPVARAMATSYQSDTTLFLNQLKQERPELEAQQREGRALLWDKNLNQELFEGYKAARVPQTPYVYYQVD